MSNKYLGSETTLFQAKTATWFTELLNSHHKLLWVSRPASVIHDTLLYS